MLRKVTLILIIFVVLPLYGAAQSVSLTMSGGGAKGLYHIGVIEALEENGIPIDYVSGTSMGSIVAGLYAAGYSPAEMRHLAESGAVERWVSGRVGPEYESLYRQRRLNAEWIALPLSAGKEKNPLQLPKGLISSAQIDLALVGLFSEADVVSGGDFNRLMVPFRCVAADMTSREAVTYSSGKLSEAIRASMSIPLAFQPVYKDEKLLYDGGIYNNFPWQVLDEDFSPEVMLGSICTAGNTISSTESNVMEQALSLVMNKTDYSMPEERSLIIHRAVGVGMLDFKRAKEIIDSGYEDAMAMMDSIKLKITARRSPEEVAARRKAFRDSSPDLVFSEYKLEGVTESQQAYVKDFLDVRHRRDTIDHAQSFAEFSDNYLHLIADGDVEPDFPSVNYDSVSESYGITLPLKIRPKMSLMIGGNISSTAFNEAYIGFTYENIARVSQRAYAEIYLGPLYLDGALGGRTTLFLKRPLFIDYSYNFSAMNGMKGHFGNLTRVDNSRKMREVENYLSVAAGIPLTRKSTLSLMVNSGVTGLRYFEHGENPDVESSRTRFLYVAPRLQIIRNSFDKKIYPTKGSHIELSAWYVYGADYYREALPYLPPAGEDLAAKSMRQWAAARFKWESYLDIASCRWFSFGFDVDAVVSNHPRFDNYESTFLTASRYAPTTHSHMVCMPELYSNKYLGVGIMPTFNITKDCLVRLSAYAMMRERFNMQEDMFQYIGDLSLVYHTRFGTASLSLTKYGIESWHNLYLTFNFGYALFAPKGTYNR